MNVGMLWLDTDKNRTLDEKVVRAAEYYENKYGYLPELCLVNSSVIEGSKAVGHIKVEAAKTVLPNHFWLGMAS